MDYVFVKTVHQGAVALSISGFFIRGLAALAGAGWVRGRAARTLPHIVDTVLLLSAVALAWMLRLSPLATPWLMAKIVGLLVYIALGSERERQLVGPTTGCPRVSGKARRAAHVGTWASGATPPGALGSPGPQGKTPRLGVLGRARG